MALVFASSSIAFIARRKRRRQLVKISVKAM